MKIKKLPTISIDNSSEDELKKRKEELKEIKREYGSKGDEINEERIKRVILDVDNFIKDKRNTGNKKREPK